VFRIQHAALVAAMVTLISSACGGTAPGNGPAGLPGGDSDTSIAVLCDNACNNTASGACDNMDPDCEASFESMPEACSSEAKAAGQCADRALMDSPLACTHAAGRC